jgi:protease-4
MLNLNVEGLFRKIGVSDTTVKSGAHKDIGSPFRKPTESDRRILQNVIDDLYARFLDRVRESRANLPGDKIRSLADGRIFTADQALKEGLVDRIGYLDDAIEDARNAAGLKKARVVLYHRPDEYAENIYSLQTPTQGRAGLSAVDLESLFGHATPRFLYLWAPGLP